jgi:hypothetical protein
MTFDQTLARLPAPTGSGEGIGVTVSLVKALTHIAYVAATDHADRDPEYIKTEMEAIASHLSEDNFPRPPACSNAFTNIQNNLHRLSQDLLSEYANWTPDQVDHNIANLAGRIMAFCVEIDKEFVGLAAPAHTQAGDLI